MNEEEKELVEGIKQYPTHRELCLIHVIERLEKELEQEKEKNKKLNLENQALFESINCNDDNMLARRYQKLQKELNKKDKVIDLLYEDIEFEYLGTSFLKPLEDYYKEVEDGR